MKQSLNRRTTKAYWEKSYVAKSLSGRPNSPLQDVFNKFLPKNSEWTAIEIGAYPGRNLAALTLSHGYSPVALDYLSKVSQLKDYFEHFGIGNVETINEDLFEWETDRQFDVVFSLGFIEHFDDPELALKRHWALLREGGYMVIGFPVFGPVQLLLRRLICTNEKFEEIVSTHNVDMAQLAKLNIITQSLQGGEEVFSGHLGNMGTWFRTSDPYVRPSRRIILRLWKMLSLGPRLVNWHSKHFSPLGAFVYMKTKVKNYCTAL